MRTLLLTCLILVLVISTFGATTTVSTTHSRSLSGWWQDCPDSCNCDYISISVYETDTVNRNLTAHTRTVDNQLPTFYVYQEHYNTCASSYSYRYVSNQESLPGLVIANNVKTARLTVNGNANVATDNSIVTADLRWFNDTAGENCGCHYWSVLTPPITTVQDYRSDWVQCHLTGWVKFGTTTYHAPSSATGTIDDYGEKTVTITKR